MPLKVRFMQKSLNYMHNKTNILTDFLFIFVQKNCTTQNNAFYS